MAVAAKPEISKILLDLGIEPVDVYAVDNAEKTYMSAVREGINTIESATKGKGDPRSEILREEFIRLRENKKKRVRASKLFTKTSIVPVNKIKPQSLLPPAEEPFSSGSQKKDGTRNILEDILRILKLGFKSDKKESEFDRKERQRQKREKKEKAIESVKGGLKSAAKVGGAVASKLLTPFQKIWQAISNFLKTVIIGALFNGALNWFGKEENREKMGRVVRFLKFWWPSILAGYLAFFTPIGALVTGVISLLTWALPALAALAKNPILAGAALFSAGAILPEVFPDLVNDEADTAVDESVDQVGTDATIDQLGEQQESRNIFQRIGDFVTGAGAEREEQTQKLETGEERGYGREGIMGGIMEGVLGPVGRIFLNKGGTVPGSGNTDTVPAMLTPGEFVMRKEAVKKYGANTLAGMNAAAGGTNKPKLGGYSGGGKAAGVVTDPKERQQQEAYMLKYVNEERALQGMEPLTNLTYAPGVELTKMRGPGPRTEETTNTNFDFDKGIKTTSTSKTVDGKMSWSGGMGLITQEDRDKFFAENLSARGSDNNQFCGQKNLSKKTYPGVVK